MFKASIKPLQTSAPTTVPNPGSASAVGETGAAPKPRGLPKNTRDYGKQKGGALPLAGPQKSPFPYGPGRLGGI